MIKRDLSVTELREHLEEQLGLLQRSAHAYDDGYRSEAKRLAITLRILLHSRKYPSLLKQLGLDTTLFVDTAPPLVAGNLLTTHSLIGLGFRAGKPSYVPLLDNGGSIKKTDFADWWSRIIIIDKENRSMSRATLVLTMADQDGGAHVDASPRSDYVALSKDNSLSWNVSKKNGEIGDPLMNPERAMVRQIAHEVLKTLVAGYSRTADDVERSLKVPEISGGKMRFYPHTEYFFRNDGGKYIVEGRNYKINLTIDSITSGSVFMIVGGTESIPIRTAGEHFQIVTAGPGQILGVAGVFTDAIVDKVAAQCID